MFDLFFQEKNTFQLFGIEHIIVLLFFVLFGITVIKLANRHLNESQKTNLGGFIAAFVLSMVLARIVILIFLGEYTHKQELPLHLCRILPFFVFPMMFKRNRFLFGILYFYIVVGTANACITPDLQYSLPNYSAILYWLIHCLLAFIPFYAIFVYKMKPSFKDLTRAIIYIHVYLVAIHLINLGLGSNYFFTIAKPLGASLLDAFGPWPWYILVADVLMWIFFAIAYLPFHKFRPVAETIAQPINEYRDL